jgi:hypothetical protein
MFGVFVLPVSIIIVHIQIVFCLCGFGGVAHLSVMFDGVDFIAKIFDDLVFLFRFTL